MDLNLSGVLQALVTAGLGGVGWWIKGLEGRLTHMELERSKDAQRIATIEAHFLDITGRLGRIESKLDRLNS